MNEATRAKTFSTNRTQTTWKHRIALPGIMLCVMLMTVMLMTDVIKVLALERNVDFTISNAQSESGGVKTVTLTVGSANWKNVVGGIAAFNIKIGYDSTVFQYMETKVTKESLITIGKDEFTATDANKDVLAVLYMDNDFKTPIPTEGAILKITFKVREGAATGGYKFKLYGDNVIVDGQLPQFNSIPVYYPSGSTVFLIGTEPTTTPTSPATTPTQAITSTDTTPTVVATPTLTPASSISSTPPVSYVDLIKSVTERIETLPERITKDNTSEVKAILKDYNKLPESERQKVVNYDKLEKANTVVSAFIAENNKLLFLEIVIVVFILIVAALAVTLIVRIRKRKTK